MNDLPTGAASVVALRDYTIRYGSFTAVDGATFDMPPGACGLLGKNGAGKSSILKAVLGLIDAARGEARVLGLDTRAESLALRDRVGYMPERETVFPLLTGLEAVILAGRLAGLPARVARQRAHEVLWLVGMGEARYRKVGTFSLGMKQKVKLAQALVHDPDLLFLDEPTNGLDPEGRREILDLLADLARKKGVSLILSSHILSDVESLCAHVVVIDSGRILRQGPVAELTRATGRLYRVRVRAKPGHDGLAGFERELHQRGLFRERREPGDYEVFLAIDQGAELVFQVARDSGVQVRLFEPQRRTLADVFLDAVNAEAARQESTAGAAATGAQR